MFFKCSPFGEMSQRESGLAPIVSVEGVLIVCLSGSRAGNITERSTLLLSKEIIDD
jgi:hypothetical protein